MTCHRVWYGRMQGHQGSSLTEKLQTAIGFGPKDSIVTDKVGVQSICETPCRCSIGVATNLAGMRSCTAASQPLARLTSTDVCISPDGIT
jgi:hypothetical protein